MIDAQMLPSGSIQIQIDGKGEDIPHHLASAFVSNILGKMQEHSGKTGNYSQQGGAILYPDAVAIEKDRTTGEPRLRLGFGQALFVISLPPGEMKKIAKAISEV